MSKLSFDRSVITGGTFTQVNNINVPARSSQSPWDRLQAAVAPAAFHNAADRFDPPRCHPNTRIGVMAELRDLALRKGAAENVRILWLNGGAGAGKSAIAQSFCEECHSQRLLLASYFFNRSDPSRNNAKSFVATLAYQIYQEVPTDDRSLILAAIQNDPLVFERAIDAHFTALIMNPLQGLIQGGYFAKHMPFVIVVDGLDECATGPVQVSILTALQNISKLPRFPFVFIVTSRPEHDIQTFFRSSAGGLGTFLRQLMLDDSFHPDADIRLFLEEKMEEVRATSPHKASIPQEWPSLDAISTLVSKSSGHFIYPSLVVKYIASSRHFPPKQLDIVLGLRPPTRRHPLAELDTLYAHILSSVEDIDLVPQILRIIMLFQDANIKLFTQDVEQLCDLDQGECLNALSDLPSVVQINETTQVIRLLHKSLSDYLQDPSRSLGYYIDTAPRMFIPMVLKVLRIISNPRFHYSLGFIEFVEHHYHLLLSNLNVRMCHKDLMSFSLINGRKTLRVVEPKDDAIVYAKPFLRSAIQILDSSCSLKGTKYENIYRHNLRQLSHLVRQYPQIYDFDSPENEEFFFPVTMIIVLLGRSEVHIPSEVFDSLQPLKAFPNFGKIVFYENPMRRYPYLAYAAARRCVYSLVHDRYSNSAGFALECLPLTLPDSTLSEELNDACNHLRSLLAHPSPGRSVAHDFMGRPYTYMRYPVAEIAKVTSTLERRACEAMQEYTERHAKANIADKNG